MLCGSGIEAKLPVLVDASVDGPLARCTPLKSGLTSGEGMLQSAR